MQLESDWRITARRVAIIAAVALLAAGVVAGSQPSPPESYYGEVTVNGDPAPDGVVVTAVVNGEVKDRITVENGDYGGPGAFEDKLAVNASEGATVEFLVGGLDTGQTDTLNPGEVTELNLTVTDTQDPTASVGSDTTVDTGATVQFNGSGASDNGQILAYEWDFDGDGTTEATGVAVNHSYADSGTYDAELTVVDIAGNTDTATRTITVESADGDTGDSGDGDTGNGGGNGGTGGGGTGGDGTTTTTTTTTTNDTNTTSATTTSTSVTSTTATTAETTTTADGTSDDTTESTTQSTTDTANGTATTTAATSTTPSDGDTGGSTGADTPGFGITSALVAVVTAGLLIARQA